MPEPHKSLCCFAQRTRVKLMCQVILTCQETQRRDSGDGNNLHNLDDRITEEARSKALVTGPGSFR
jgi:hypothetical protein